MIIFEFIKKYKGPFIFAAIVLVLFYMWYFLYNMQIKKETEHFEIRCTFKDEKIVDELSEKLEDAYKIITKDLNIVLDKKITVRIYPSMFHYKRGVRNCNWSDTWIFFSSAQFKDIRMMSPQYKKIDEFTHNDYIRSSIHSLVHAIMLKNDNSFNNMPMWLTEGIAVYETDKALNDYSEHVKNIVNNNDIPDFKLLSIPHDKSVLRTINSTPFAKRHGHEFSYTIIDFIVKEHGYNKLNELKDYNDDYYKVLGYESKDDFVENWNEFLKDEYLK